MSPQARLMPSHNKIQRYSNVHVSVGIHLLVAVWLVLALTACGPRVRSPEQAAVAPQLAPSPAVPSPIPAPSRTATTTPLPVATWTAEVSATFTARLLSTTTPEQADTIGIEGVNVLPVAGSDGHPLLWIAHTYGIRSFDPRQDHVVSVYQREETDWREQSRFTLVEADYIDPQSVSLAWVGPQDTVWLTVESAVGAHGGCFDLLRFAEGVLHSEVASCNSSPFAGELRDLNGDQVVEVIVNQSDNYVFCYACGVRFWQYQVFRQDGAGLAEVRLVNLDENAPDDLRRLNNRAVELAQAGLWLDARQTLDQISDPGDHPTVAWNAVLIRLHADARAEQVRHGTYPLLENIFYGDYAAALDVMRPIGAAELFSQPNPLVEGTVADGWEHELVGWITSTTMPAIQARPDLAEAFFLRGWATFLVDPYDPAVFDNVQRAAQLDPTEPLFTQSLAHLEQLSPPDAAFPLEGE